MMKRGRPKGYSPYVDITYEDLGNYIGAKGVVKVSRAWVESIEEANSKAYSIEELINKPQHKVVEQEKIEFKLIDLNDE